MNERDWRIFREDFNIGYRGVNTVRAGVPGCIGACVRAWAHGQRIAHMDDRDEGMQMFCGRDDCASCLMPDRRVLGLSCYAGTAGASHPQVGGERAALAVAQGGWRSVACSLRMNVTPCRGVCKPCGRRFGTSTASQAAAGGMEHGAMRTIA
mgnify:CR=1 FL=1